MKVGAANCWSKEQNKLGLEESYGSVALSRVGLKYDAVCAADQSFTQKY